MKPGDKVRVHMTASSTMLGTVTEVTRPPGCWVYLFDTPDGDRISGWFAIKDLEPIDPTPTPAMRSTVSLLRGGMSGARATARKLHRDWGSLSESRIENALVYSRCGEMYDRRATVRR